MAIEYIRKNSNVAGYGKRSDVSSCKRVTLAISGSSDASFITSFKGSHDGASWFPIMADRLDDSSISATDTSTLDQAWDFDVEGIEYINTYLSISAGTITETIKKV